MIAPSQGLTLGARCISCGRACAYDPCSLLCDPCAHAQRAVAAILARPERDAHVQVARSPQPPIVFAHSCSDFETTRES